MDFALDKMALLLCVALLAAAYAAFQWRRRYLARPTLLYPDLTGLRKVSAGWRPFFAQLPRYFLLGALLCFAAAFSVPRSLIAQKGAAAPQSNPVEGIALYFVLDQSGSMAESVAKMPKIEVLKR